MIGTSKFTSESLMQTPFAMMSKNCNFFYRTDRQVNTHRISVKIKHYNLMAILLSNTKICLMYQIFILTQLKLSTVFDYIKIS